jgi:hypothetical protein
MVVKRKGRKMSISRRSWDLLTPSLKETRKRSLSVLSMMRRGSTLAAAASEVGIDPRTVSRHLGAALVKRESRYHAKPTDRISRSMVVYSKGKQADITVADSRTASIIGQYFNAVRKFLNTGDKTALEAFKDATVIDIGGTTHLLETNVRRLKKIESAKEDREFFEIYKNG